MLCSQLLSMVSPKRLQTLSHLSFATKLFCNLFSDLERLFRRLVFGDMSSNGIISSMSAVGAGRGDESLLFWPLGDVEEADLLLWRDGFKCLFWLSSATADPGIAGPLHKGLCLWCLVRPSCEEWLRGMSRLLIDEERELDWWSADEGVDNSMSRAIWCIFRCRARIRPLVSLCFAAIHLMWSSNMNLALSWTRRTLFWALCLIVIWRDRESSLSALTSTSWRKATNLAIPQPRRLVSGSIRISCCESITIKRLNFGWSLLRTVHAIRSELSLNS